MIAEGDEYTPTPGHFPRHPLLQPWPHFAAWPTASSSRRRTTRRKAVATSTTLPTAARPTPTSPSGSKPRPTNCWPTSWPASNASATSRRSRPDTTHRHDYLNTYVADLINVIDIDAIRGAKLRLGVDPLGGAGVRYWSAIAEHYRLNLDVVNKRSRPDVPFHDASTGTARSAWTRRPATRCRA